MKKILIIKFLGILLLANTCHARIGSTIERAVFGTEIATHIVWALAGLYRDVTIANAANTIASAVDDTMRGNPQKPRESDPEEMPDEISVRLPANPDGLHGVFAGTIPPEITEIIEFLSSPEKFIRLGAVMPRGILLVGPPGTGKTTIARGIAEYAGCLFLSVNGSEFIEEYVGTGAKRVRELFEQARSAIAKGSTKAVIIFIDEIDAIGCKRSDDNSGADREYRQTLIQLLTLMDGFKVNDSIVVIAATNRADSLDPALLRPGRFDRKVHIGLPTQENRAAILRFHMAKSPIDDDVQVDILAVKTKGFSGAQLKSLVNEAAIRAAREDAETICMRHFLSALHDVFGKE